VDSPKREGKVLGRLMRDVRKLDMIVTYNGKSFDLPFLVSRGLILGVPDLDLDVLHHLDIYEQCRRVLRFDKLGLDHVARVLGIEVESGYTGREVPHLYLAYLSERRKEIKNEIINHCLSDISMLERVYKKIRPLLLLDGAGQ
jgi:hypothetical protein